MITLSPFLRCVGVRVCVRVSVRACGCVGGCKIRQDNVDSVTISAVCECVRVCVRACGYVG